MKDIPVFDTPWGISSLILKEIPYRGEAYIRVQKVSPGGLQELLRECASFCRMAGAERIYATGWEGLEEYEHHCHVLNMSGPGAFQPEAELFPVTEQTVERWRGIFNERMADVDNSAYLSQQQEKDILSSGGAYFVHGEGRLLGIGWVEEGKLIGVVSVKRGSGAAVVKTLLSAQSAPRVTLEVASTNQRAIALYRRLGFVTTGIRSSWYCVP